jgi:hypothetical protein
MMTEEDFATLNGDFDDFLYKVVMNYDVNYPALAAVIMGRMVSLAQISNMEDILLQILPHMENKLKGQTDGRIH